MSTKKKKEKQKRKSLAAAAIAIAALSLAGPTLPSPVPAFADGVEQASAQKSGNGGGQAEQVGDNAADLLSGILVPILIVAIGAIALVALARREIGMAISVTFTGLIAGWFLMAPDSVERTFTAIYDRIF